MGLISTASTGGPYKTRRFSSSCSILCSVPPSPHLLVAADLDFVPTSLSLFLRPSLTSLASAFSEFHRFFTFLEMADLALGVFLEAAFSRAAEEIARAWGVDKELKKLAEKMETIQALLSDAQRKQLTSKLVQVWLKRLGSAALDAQIVLDDFGYEVLRQKVECRKRKWDEVCSFFSSSNPVVDRLRMAREIKDAMSSIEEVLAESNQIGLKDVVLSPSPHLTEKRSTEPFIDDSEIVGREDDTSKVINMLVGSDYKIGLPVITILGMGGQGKTTLAQLVYKNEKILNNFDKRAWVCVSDGDFNIERLLAQMLVSLKVKVTEHQPTNAEALVGRLKEELSGKRYLLVLDDVWNEDVVEWDRMRRCLQEIGGSKGSKVLATTRSELVAKAMHTSEHHWLKVLSEEQSWKLFEKWAFADGGAENSPQFVDIGKRILKRCGGVPLAIRVMGGLLYSNNCDSEWWSMIERSELWSASGEGNRVFSAIKLSYDHLPSLALKQCFAYCAIFRKDTEMKKDELIQLWMAQGLLNPPKGSNLQMEDMGSIYFNSLLRSSLLEDAGKVGYDNIRYCKMHDLVHDFSLRVSENYCFHVKDWKDVDDEIKAVHLSIIASEGDLSKNFKDIVPPTSRTLHLKLKGSSVLVDLFANFKCLTVLILEDENIKELPNSIGKMKHLRFLDVSSCGKIRRLPNWITELYYLQTLKVYKLDEVPEGFWKLINLRHFYICGFDKYSVPELLIPRLSQLTNLQSLPFYKVDKCNGCQIEELEQLDNLKGVLRIYGLQNVRTRESALKSNLSKKSKVQTLHLHWDGGREENCDDSDVMEGLKPHSNLKSLRMEGYESPKFPSWMVARNDLRPPLSNLVKLILEKLNKCEQLPSLGDLPCLEHLEIWGLENVRCIGEEFYGWRNMEWVKKRNCSNGSQITLFPSLKVFKLEGMRNLVEWSDAIAPADAHSSSVEVFPVLEDIEIYSLPQLCSFPNLGCLPKLRRLKILNCGRLTNIPSNWNGVGTHQKSEFEDERAASTHDSCVVSSCSVGVGPSSSSCPPRDDLLLVNVPNFHYLPSLRRISLVGCDEFAATFCSLKILAPLECLEIAGKLSLWPKDLHHHLINLTSLILEGSYDVNASEAEEEVDCFPFPFSISNVNVTEVVPYFPCLTYLALDGYGLRNVTSLPDQIQYLTSLMDLEMSNFERLEALPEWLGNLTSLQNLTVWNCGSLKQLPSAEAFQRLINLKRLEIGSGCDNMKEVCTEGSGSEWPKIAPLIPNLEFHI